MSARPTRSVSPTTRARWPFHGAAQVLLLVAALVTVVASFLPWIATPFGQVAIVGAGPVVRNAPLITLYAGFLALPGAAWRSGRIVLVHALVLAVPAVILPLAQLGWALRRLPGLGSAWVPGPGMVLVAISGAVAAYAAAVLWRRAVAARP